MAMKGLIKGLRHISNIFENGKEQEMQIGYPTDVKHVAHIGWDGPSVTSPSWMNEFRIAPEFSSAPLSINREAKETAMPRTVSEDLTRTGAGIQDSLARDVPELPKPMRSHRRRSTGPSASIDSPTQDPPRQSRRHQSTDGSVNSPSRDLSLGSKPRRRSKNSGAGLDSPLQELPAIPKQSRRRKSKGSSDGSLGGGSSRSSRSTIYTSPFLDPVSGSELVNNELCPTSTLKSFGKDEEKEHNGIS